MSYNAIVLCRKMIIQSAKSRAITLKYTYHSGSEITLRNPTIQARDGFHQPALHLTTTACGDVRIFFYRVIVCIKDDVALMIPEANFSVGYRVFTSLKAEQNMVSYLVPSIFSVWSPILLIWQEASLIELITPFRMRMFCIGQSFVL